METIQMNNQVFFPNNFPNNNNFIFNSNIMLNPNQYPSNNINMANSQDKDIKRLTKFEYNKNVNIYEDENYEFKQIAITSEKDIYTRLRHNMKYFSAFLNSNSGILYFGINDDGIIKGIELTKELKYSFELELNKII